MKLKTPPPPEYVFRYHRWPADGNKLNGVGEANPRRATRVFHWTVGRKPHPFMALDMHFNMISAIGRPIFGWGVMLQRVLNLWQLRRANGPVAKRRTEVSDPKAMAERVKAWARQVDECVVGITRVRDNAIVEGETVPYEYAIVISHPMRREAMLNVPEPVSNYEVLSAYRRVARIAVVLSERIRALGWPAKAYGDTKTGDILHIPLAIGAGLGQLGKHGSMICREYGSNFRLSSVGTDLPLALDEPVDIGIDDLCISCRRCTIDCPPGAINDKKLLVRGIEKWYVDFNKCVPYFAEHGGCAICLEVCPWSEPGRGFKLSETLLAKRSIRSAATVGGRVQSRRNATPAAHY